jgi:hypothetical protein
MVYIICCPVMLEMNSYMIATTALIATAVLIAATIAVPVFSNSAYAVRPNNLIAQGAQNNAANAQAGLVNANVPVQANLQLNCAVSVLADCQ